MNNVYLCSINLLQADFSNSDITIQMNRFQFGKLLIYIYILGMLTACSATKFIPDGSYMLDKVSVKTDSKSLRASDFHPYIKQYPNSRWFSLVKVPMGPYALSGKDSTKVINRFLQKIGEAPVVYDSLLMEDTRRDMQAAVANMGYLNAEVSTWEIRKKKKIELVYNVHSRQRYYVRRVAYEFSDSLLWQLFAQQQKNSLLRSGMPFDVNRLDAERNRLSNLFLENGYYKFNKELIRFDADTTVGEHLVDLTMYVLPMQTDSIGSGHRQYRIRNIRVYSDVESPEQKDLNVLEKEGCQIYYKDHLNFRPSFLADKITFASGDIYNDRTVQYTYRNFGRLQALSSAAVRMEEVEDSALLDCNVLITSNKTHSFETELEGTNSAGDLGAALALTYQNRNLFKGSELFSIKLRGAFEAITGLEGYTDQNYLEYSIETGLTFPDFKFPFLTKRYRSLIQTTSEIALMYDLQNRPEFHRRVVTGALRYRWSNRKYQLQHRVDLIDLNYVFMPWISETFKNDYLDDEDNRNSILRYNYENLFIMKLGYSLSYNSQGDGGPNSSYGKNATGIRFNVESAGNLLYGFSNLLKAQRGSEGQYTLFNIAYAQYVKADIDLSRSIRFDNRNSLALHLGLGVAYPYGNSKILPFEKRYFSGGANSVRGWSVRELGPGRYSGTDGRIDFINATGDIKLDMNIEYRTFLFWKLHGAIFVDAGNIWTIREYTDQPGGQFLFNQFYKQIAVSYGIGLRLNFDFFILRLDGGMKAVNPAYTTRKEHFPLFSPNFGRDFALHFAVGLPF